MAALAELLGEKLQSKTGEVATSSALEGKGAVALYFSAHWCPPCRGFTPQLAGWYTEGLKAKGLEVVFVSSDKDESAFAEYFGEQPWLALPFADRERKASLSKRFKVSGIPTVVILGPDGKVITKDGRSAISGDTKGENFPWRPKPLKEVLGAKFLGQGGAVLGPEALEGKVVGLYFSAHWCPPCKGFTPQLAEWYKKMKAKGLPLEIVFVSSDRDEAAWKEYFAEMPWLALDFADSRKQKEELSGIFGVRGIPSLVFLDKDKDLSTITKEGRAVVAEDPEGAEFPWYPKPVKDLAKGPGSINEVPSVIALCEAGGAEVQAAAVEAMTPLAQRFLDEQKAKGEEDPEVAFMVSTQVEGLAGRIRELLKLPAPAASGQAPRLVMLDIPEDGAFYLGPEGEITKSGVEKFVADYQAKALERKQLSSD